MEFRDLKTQYQVHKENIDSAISEVLCAGTFISGKQVSLLEEELAKYVGVKHCITCANGTDALQLALMAWNIGEGDAVFVPDFTFFSSGEVVPMVGATPFFVDIDIDTFNICPYSLEKTIEYVINNTNLNPKVIVAVDLFGQPADYLKLREVARKYNMLILEDAAQGFGGRIGENVACSFGDISTTSFFPAKPLGCYGDGGAIFTNNDEWAELLRSYRVHGKGKDKYDNIRIGMNSRLDTIQAAVLLEKLKFFDDEVEDCNRIASWYNEQFNNIQTIKTPTVKTGYISSWAQYTICIESRMKRDKIIEELKKYNIPAMIYYKKAMHEQEAFRDFYFDDLYGCKIMNSSDVCGRCLSLPMSSYIERDDIRKIGKIIEDMVID